MTRRDIAGYTSLLTAYTKRQVDAEDFVAEYLRIWREDIARERECTTPEQVTERDRLIDLLKGGMISREQFSTEYDRIFGVEIRDEALTNAIDALHSTASNYTTSVELLHTGYYVREPELREHAGRLLEMLLRYQRGVSG